MGSGFSKRKKEAKAMQEQLMKMQEQLKKTEVEGSAGNGLVTVKMNGEHELLSVSIKPECVDPDDIEGLEDLLKAAFADAHKKVGSSMSGGSMPDLSSMLGGGGFPGF